ncbi:hypothetical protein AAMO2058_000614100 [Amorphochlora amoebiformis]
MPSRVLALALLFSVGLSCKTKHDCFYNGECIQGECHCVPYFTGPRCGKFNFSPADKSLGEGLKSLDKKGLQRSSWGGSVLLADDGKYHMWAAEMTNEAGIKTWITNSQVVHAVADDPERPFEFKRKEVVWDVFAHEPTVSRAPTGEFVMFFSTSYGEKGIPCTGKQCFGYNGTSDESCPNDQQCFIDEPLLTRMSYAKDPNGPWSTPKALPDPGKGDTNMACYIHNDSSILCAARPTIGMYRHHDWKDIENYENFIPDTSAILPNGEIWGEDPMLWMSHDGVYHMVTHGGGWDCPFGFHYYSLDGYKWYGDCSVRVYEHIVEQKFDKPLNLSRRERPHVIYGQDGHTPIALTNGVTSNWPCTFVPKPEPGTNGTYILCPKDYCYTLIQPLNGWEEMY